MLFSVIVPIYNAEKYLDQCITSVLKQTYTDFELILVDDESRDNCGKIIDAYGESDSRVCVLHKSNGGPGSSRKFGLEKARGEYIVLLDSDDWLEKDALACMADTIKKFDPDIVCHGSILVANKSRKKQEITSEEVLYGREQLEKEILPTMLLGSRSTLIKQELWGKAFRKALYAKYQQTVDDRIKIGEDGIIVYACICEAKSICFLPECLYNYRISPNSITRSKMKQIPWEEALLRIEYLKRHLPLEKYNMRQQLGCYAAHAVFNVILTQLRHRPYREVKEEVLQNLASSDLVGWIRGANNMGSRSEKLAQFVLCNRWIWLIKLYSMIR